MSRQKGIALLSVLMITVVVSALAYHLVSRHSMTIAATRIYFDSSGIREYNLAAEQLAIEELHKDWSDEQSRQLDSLTENWAVTFSVEFSTAKIQFAIIDSLSKFNLNGAANSGDAFVNLAVANLFQDLELPQNLQSLWMDWIDTDQIPLPAGAEDFTWLVNSPPTRTPNTPVTDISEIRTLQPLTRNQFDALRRVATVLPTNSVKVNINTVNSAVLMAMDKTLNTSTLNQVDSITRNFKTVDEAIAVLPELARLAGHLTVTSRFFELQSTTTIDGRRSDYVAYLYRNPETGQIVVYERDFGLKVDQERFQIYSKRIRIRHHEYFGFPD